MNDPKKLASKGRYGDTMLAHINPEEAALLKSRGGAGTINPKTGLPEFYMYAGYGLSDQATLDAQKAAEKAATKKAAGPAPPPALTAEQRQARIARDLALSQTRGGRPSGQDSQFYQPAYQPQYANYATTNPLGVSQYGTPMTPSSLVDSAYAGIGRFGVGTGTNQMDAGGRQNHINAFQTLEYTPENFFQKFANSVRDYQTQNPNDRYTQYMQNQPGYMGGYQGYMPQMQSPQQMQTPFNPYTNQYQSPFSYQQPQYQQMQTPFSYQQPMAQRTSGPSQAIVGRSSQMRGTPNVMRRAKGGITSLLKKHK